MTDIEQAIQLLEQATRPNNAVDYMRLCINDALSLLRQPCEPPKTGSIRKALDAIYEAGGKAWDDIEDPEKYIAEPRGAPPEPCEPTELSKKLRDLSKYDRMCGRAANADLSLSAADAIDHLTQENAELRKDQKC